MSASFDTQDYARELKDAGFSRQQAEVQVKALARAVEGRLATKNDISDLTARLRDTELRLQREIEQVRNEIKSTELAY